MAKLIDAPGVAELVAKREATAIKTTLANVTRKIKAVTKEHLEFHQGGSFKDGVNAVKNHSKAILDLIKEA